MKGGLTQAQQTLLDRLDASDLADTFYLTGGTALSAFYFHHRDSLDLDLFAREPFDPKRVVAFINSVAEAPPIPRRVHQRYEFTVPLRDARVRVEFVHYAFDWIEPPRPMYRRIRVDGLRDILANKLSAIIERTEGKDFADLFFLLRQPGLSLAQGMADCHRKFGWPGLRYVLQARLLASAALSALPETEPPLSLDQLQEFCRGLARTLIRVGEDTEGTSEGSGGDG